LVGLPGRAALLLALFALTGCGLIPAGEPDLNVDNGTTLRVTIVVNGSQVETVEPSTVAVLKPEALPKLPWNVQALSPSGREVLVLVVNPGQVQSTSGPNGESELTGAAARVDLSCGRLDVWAGPPLAGPMPGPGVTGDCEP
jgi:hypothetical protein